MFFCFFLKCFCIFAVEKNDSKWNIFLIFLKNKIPVEEF